MLEEEDAMKQNKGQKWTALMLGKKIKLYVTPIYLIVLQLH